MPLSNYVGQYGETLRRLTALSTGQPQAIGAADASGAGPSAPPPGALSDPSAAGPALGGGPPPPTGGGPQGVLGGGGPPPPGALSGPSPAAAPASPQSQIGLSHLLDASTHEEREHMTKQLEAQGVDINGRIDELKQRGFVPPDAKLTRQQKGALLTEFGLRMMAASSQGNDAFAAAGIAGQGLLESIRASKESDTKESTRQRERQQELDLGQQEKAAERKARSGDISAEIEGRHADTAAETASREKIAGIEAKSRLQAAKAEARRTNKPSSYVSEDGTLKMITSNEDGSFSVSTPTEDVVTETTEPGTGRNGMPHKVQTTKKKPVRPMQKVQPGNTVDPDTVQRVIEQEKTRLSNDVATKRELRAKGLTGAAADAEIERQARANVQSRLPGNGASLSGNDPLGLMGGGAAED